MKKSIILFLMLSLFLSCNKDNNTEEVKTPVLTGNIDFIDQFGETLHNIDGVKITVNETGEQAIADNLGRFELYKLDDGNQYSLEIYKENFTHLKNYKFDFIKYMSLNHIILSELCDTHIDSIASHTPPYIQALELFVYSTSPDTLFREVGIYCSNESNVSYENYLFKDYGPVANGGIGICSIFKVFWDFSIYDKVYVKVYPKPKGQYTLDVNEDGVVIDPGLNLNNVLTTEYQIR